MRLLRALELFEQMQSHGSRAIDDLKGIAEGPVTVGPLAGSKRGKKFVMDRSKLQNFLYKDDLRHIVGMLNAVLEGYGESCAGLASDDEEMANDAKGILERIEAYLAE